MSNSVDSLKQRLAAGESTDRDFIELEGAIDSAFHISRALIAVGEPSRLDRSVVDVNELVAQLEGVLARVLGSNIRLALRLEAVDPLVQAEAVQLEWVFFHLASNSRDAMPNGGNFLVHTASVDRPVGTPSRMQRFVRVSVTDTGMGLFGDARTRAVDPFFSTKEGAPGLGLTSVAMIVRNFQGWLHIQSDGSGTSIHMHFPTLGPSTR
ncbi:MAG TPA: ATP-binding protein [Vicinamibacterales bacterium]|nr:ATP-binding protein [Vicinamibacterales bacterium]